MKIRSVELYLEILNILSKRQSTATGQELRDVAVRLTKIEMRNSRDQISMLSAQFENEDDGE